MITPEFYAPAIVLTALLLAVGHWFPWVRDMTLITRYTCGVLCLWAGLMLWLALEGQWWIAIGFLGIAVAGGATVVGAYAWDEVVRRWNKADMLEDLIDEEE